MILKLTNPLGLRGEITQVSLDQINVRDGKVYFTWLDADGVRVGTGGSQADIVPDVIPNADDCLVAIETDTTPTTKAESVEKLQADKVVLQDKIDEIDAKLDLAGVEASPVIRV